MITRALIEKFRKNECDALERREVLAHFEANPEEWDQYINEAQWDAFEPTEKLTPAVSERIADRVIQQTVQKGRFKKRLLRGLSVAASVIVAVLVARMLYQQHSDTGAITAKEPNGQSAPLVRKWNNTGKDMMILLQDSSVVALSPNSSITYHQPFTAGNKRTIYLLGKAMFQVAKDKRKPFTVVSGEIATTALGTAFTVMYQEQVNDIKVKLHEGKVVVQSSGAAPEGPLKETFLVPGDELVYNRHNRLASITHFVDGREQWASAQPAPTGNSTIKKPDWYMFNGLLLTQVLEQLSQYYQAAIYYRPSEISNKYFTCKVEKTDSLESILADIALLNKLVIEKKNNAYYIRKK
jgi:ferric-dicitrate binding protein FerR (iron transport regulator)